MLPDINNSKEVIKNRMLKHALNYWGIKNTDDLDPSVKLILEALSSELFNFGNEIKDSQIRILEKIANLLAPDFLTSPNPAHAILHAAPVEASELLKKTTSFFTERKISSKQNEVLDTTLDIFFTPVDSVQLHDVHIAYMVTGGNLFSYNESSGKQLTARYTRGKIPENYTLTIGLRVNPKIEDIQNLFFCFNWKSLESKLAYRTYQLLPLTKWWLDDIELEIAPGINYSSRANGEDNFENIFLKYDLLPSIENDVKHFYDHKFITIRDKRFMNISEFKRPYPSSFKNLFAENDLQKLNEKLLWLKIVFPGNIQQEFLDEIDIYTNAFPVINRQLNDLKFRLKGGSNIIPLKTGAFEQFLAIKSLSDDTNKYKSVPYRKTEDEESGSYTLRNGGVERFDKRNANELINYLLELLRSESAAFSSYGYDFIATTLKEMNQKISLMEQKTKGYIDNSGEVPNYIVVKPFEGKDMMYSEYWTTVAEIANNLRTGAKLQLAKGVKLKADSITLITSTVGGKSRLRPEERLHAFRYGIMTRDRIITKEDIRNFCFYELGDRINRVEVERGFEMSLHAKEGFKRTIDVMLTPSQTEMLENSSWR